MSGPSVGRPPERPAAVLLAVAVVFFLGVAVGFVLGRAV